MYCLLRVLYISVSCMATTTKSMVSVVIRTLNLWIFMNSSSFSPARNSEPQLRVQVRIMVAVAIGICRSLLAIRSIFAVLSTLAVLLAHFGTPNGVMISSSKSMDLWKGSFHFIRVHSKWGYPILLFPNA